MTNTEKLNKLRMLGSVRERLGADSQEDEAFDEQINQMSNTDLVKHWCGWHLGDGSWWTDMKNMFDSLEDLDKN